MHENISLTLTANPTESDILSTEDDFTLPHFEELNAKIDGTKYEIKIQFFVLIKICEFHLISCFFLLENFGNLTTFLTNQEFFNQNSTKTEIANLLEQQTQRINELQNDIKVVLNENKGVYSYSI